MLSELSEEKAKIIFVVVVAIFIIVLLVISYYIYFDEDNEKNNEEINKKINNIKTLVENNNKMNANINSDIKNNIPEKEVVPVKQNEPLNNVRNESYKNKKGKQVFNISNNLFTYNEAEAVCKAFNSELASEKQVKEAYDNGADWCNYGWSKNQMALFPTQKSSWEQLQKDPMNRNSCGMWGVNGGYFENPDTLFGVNCYGLKPEPKDNERNKIPSVSKREQAIQEKIVSVQQNLNDVAISPFNKNLWSNP